MCGGASLNSNVRPTPVELLLILQCGLLSLASWWLWWGVELFTLVLFVAKAQLVLLFKKKNLCPAALPVSALIIGFMSSLQKKNTAEINLNAVSTYNPPSQLFCFW